MTMGVTARRTTAFSRRLLSAAGATIGLADVGSGGQRKAPWRHLPTESLAIFDFEPTQSAKPGLPLCVSDRITTADFYVAHDERSSSFHMPNEAFVKRFDQQGLLPKKRIRVDCTTLDEFFRDTLETVDAVDINVEGHDLAVLRGGESLLRDGCVKLLKVEFELADVWHGQGYFGDIIAFMRTRGFDLADIEIGYARPANVGHFYNKGEPVWGKGYFVPSAALWQTYLQRVGATLEANVFKAVALYVAAGLPGRAFDIIDIAPQTLTIMTPTSLKEQIAHVHAWSKIEFGLSSLARLAEGVLPFSGWSK